MNTSSTSPANSDMPLLIALGNRFRGDDGVGHHIAEQIKARDVKCHIVANQDDSMGLINAWEHASLVVVIDAAQTGANPGTIHELDAGNGAVPRELARCSSHGVGLAEAVELGKILGLLPARLLVYAVEAEHFDAGEPLSPAVRDAAETVTGMIEERLNSATT